MSKDKRLQESKGKPLKKVVSESWDLKYPQHLGVGGGYQQVKGILKDLGREPTSLVIIILQWRQKEACYCKLVELIEV